MTTRLGAAALVGSGLQNQGHDAEDGGAAMLTNDDITALNRRAREVGESIGWELVFAVAPDSEFVGLCAGHDRIIVLGPSRVSDLAVHEIDLALDALQRGDRRIILDEDGDPCLA